MAAASCVATAFEQRRPIPECSHDMCISQYQVVDTRVLEALRKARTNDRVATAARSVA
jgi:hypothetical protein